VRGDGGKPKPGSLWTTMGEVLEQENLRKAPGGCDAIKRRRASTA
jgi:hypothetical protein